jgi:hypothetical protein
MLRLVVVLSLMAVLVAGSVANAQQRAVPEPATTTTAPARVIPDFNELMVVVAVGALAAVTFSHPPSIATVLVAGVVGAYVAEWWPSKPAPGAAERQ